jgi:5-methylcytosine-specific restriction protein A
MQDETKREHKRFYDSALWKRVRLGILRNEPYCRECRRQGRLMLADMVDHITPIGAGGARVVASNLQPLCNGCHAVKRQSEGMELRVS